MKRREQRPTKCLSHYVRPYLAIDRIESAPAGRLTLLRGSRRLSLSIEGDLAGAAALFEALSDPASAAWQETLAESDPGLLTLLDRLDRLGWITEGDRSAQAHAEAQRASLEAFVAAAADWLCAAMDEFASGTLCAAVSIETYRAAMSGLAESTGRSPRPNDVCSSSFVLSRSLEREALDLLLRRWESTAPLALQLTKAAFRTAAGRVADNPAPDPELDDLALALASPQDAMNQAWIALIFFVRAMAGGRGLQCLQHLPVGDLSGPGLNVLLKAEDAGERLTAALGRSPLVDLIERGTATRRTAAGVYMHQYFITVRYVEAVLSFLRHQLRAPLKATGWRYLMEEYGHEIHELRACFSLGITEAEIAEFAPLPYFAAYPDILSLIGEEDPLAFCLAVTIAEGMPGTTKPIAEALHGQGVVAESLTAHQDIDEALDHSLYTRRLLQHVSWVGGHAADRAIRRFLFVLELSQACWSELAWYAGSPELPLVPRVLELSPRQVLLGRLWGQPAVAARGTASRTAGRPQRLAKHKS